jgi:hypothetical protein
MPNGQTEKSKEETKMRFLRRLDDEQRRPANGNDGPDSDDQLQQLRSDGDRLLAAGDRAIQRALGANSEAFLRAGRQQGGE